MPLTLKKRIKPVRLPEFPKGKEYEEFIAAIFQAGGYFIERRITKREVKEILELDIIFSNYSSSCPKIILLEAKSGDWGFKDIFKIRGWMDHLNISDGLFIAKEEKEYLELYKRISESLNINLIIISDLENSREALSELINTEEIDKKDIIALRFSSWMERNLIKRLKKQKKCNQNMKCYRELEKYYFNLNSGIFFEKNIIKKIIELYKNYKDYPNISARTGNELLGNSFDDEIDILHRDFYEDTFYECKYNDIQISTFIEHRARLAILKNAIDYKLYKSAGDNSRTNEALDILGLDSEVSLLDLLPDTFKSGLDTISQNQYYNKYPIFWQWFMWLFGGFILKDYEEREYELLSKKTGIPPSEIPNALESYNLLFPQDDGWFIEPPCTNIKIMKMFPVPFRGIGGYYRGLKYDESGKINQLNLSGLHTLDDLIRWNNLGVKVLSK